VLRERASGGQELVDGAALFVMIGATPHTGWLPDSILRDDRGFIRTGPTQRPATRQLAAGPATPGVGGQPPGVFPVGDVRAGSVKRVASAVGEGSVAIQQVHQYLRPARL